MKKFSFVFTSILAILSFVFLGIYVSNNLEATTPPLGAEGNPFLVATYEDLKAVGREEEYKGNVWGLDSHYKQVADITIPEGENWEPIGSVEEIDEIGFPIGGDYFNGSYDGGNYVIKNLKIVRPESSHLAMFSWAGPDASFYNILLKDVFVSGGDVGASLVGINGLLEINGNSFVPNGGVISNVSVVGANLEVGSSSGGLVGINMAEIYNSHIDVSISSSSDGIGFVGGLIGISFADIEGSSTFVSMNFDAGGGRNFGGLVGVKIVGGVKNSYSFVDIDISNGGQRFGGLVGELGGVLENSYVEGNIVAPDLARVGGLVGEADLDAKIKSSYFSGEIEGLGYDTGGLVGLMREGSSLKNSYALNSLIKTNENSGIGRVTGDCQGTCSNNYAFGDMVLKVDGTVEGFPDFHNNHDSKDGEDVRLADAKSLAHYTDDGNHGAEGVWDFDNIWMIREGVGFPFLKREVESLPGGLDFEIEGSNWENTSSIKFKNNSIGSIKFNFPSGFNVLENKELLKLVAVNLSVGYDLTTGTFRAKVNTDVLTFLEGVSASIVFEDFADTLEVEDLTSSNIQEYIDIFVYEDDVLVVGDLTGYFSWDNVVYNADTDTLTLPVNHFTEYVVGLAEAESEEETETSSLPETGSSIIILFSLGIISLSGYFLLKRYKYIS